MKTRDGVEMVKSNYYKVSLGFYTGTRLGVVAWISLRIFRCSLQKTKKNQNFLNFSETTRSELLSSLGEALSYPLKTADFRLGNLV